MVIWVRLAWIDLWGFHFGICSSSVLCCLEGRQVVRLKIVVVAFLQAFLMSQRYCLYEGDSRIF